MWSTILSAILVVNELMASNAGEVMSPATNFDSWIELYNPDDQGVNLSGMYLSNDAENLTLWKMPSNLGTVPAKGFLVVWLGSNDIKTNQAPFKLDCDGGTIYLSDKNGQLVTSQDYPEALSRTSYARKSDGGDEWGWTAMITPGTTNTTAVFADQRLSEPVVDQGSQLFKGSLKIKVDIPEGTTLMYTTDGSVPKTENTATKQSTDGQFTINKTTNYVFRLFKDGYLPSVPVTRSYIKTNDTYTIPVVSIVGNEKYFTDPMWGIDVVGKNGKSGNGRDDAVNWNMDWDRPVNFSYISPTEGMLFNQDVNISVSGGWTRMIEPRSMKLKSNKIFDGQNRFDYSFFPQKPYIRNKTLLLRNGGNDVWRSHARFMDPALTTIIQRSGIDLDVQSTVQVVEYVNGQFRGVVNLREPTNDKFAYANFGYDDDEIDMFENNEFKNGTRESFDKLCNLAKHINDPGVYDEVKALLDIDEFTNYMAAELYLGHDDWPDNNVKAYRSQDNGRWRFVCFDLDYAFYGRNRQSSPGQSLDDYKDVAIVTLFLNLIKHDEYRKKFIDTFCLMGGSVFERQRATVIVDELAEAMRPMSELDGYVPDNAANTIKNCLKTQMATMANLLQKYSPMKLTNVKKLNVALNADNDEANLYINGLQVPYASFDGQLFEPVTVEAKAPVGYTFTGWKKGSSASVELIKSGDTWKYFDKGAPASDWKSDSFNDSGWSSGPAPLGYKMTGVKTTVSYGSDSNRKNPATYFRKTISLSDTPTRSDVFLLNYGIDDGFVVYVNGKEAGRLNMGDGNITYNSFATTYAGDTPITGTLELSSSLFKNGSNTIAVEIHNNSYTSSDQYWDAELLTSVGAGSDEVVSTDPVLDLTADNGKLSLVACFTPLSDAEQAANGLTPVRINEVSAANGIYVNEYFKRNDWVELYNTTNNPVDIEGMYLSDDENTPKKYQISKGETQAETVIPAHGYLIVWCDKLEPETQLHADFKLDANGGIVMLTAADESWSDCLTYNQLLEDQTVGRYPDGASDIFVMNIPTIAKANITSSYVTKVDQPQETGIHNLMADATDAVSLSYRVGSLVVSSSSTDDLQLKIVNLAGQTLMNVPVLLNGGYAEVGIEQLPAGVYIASIADKHGQKASCKFVINTTQSR